MSCEKKDHVIEIINAKYGRALKIICEPNSEEKKQDKYGNLTRTCGMKNVLDKMLPLCEGKQICDKFVVNATEFGEPGKCRGVRTYLEMDIKCGRSILIVNLCQSI